MGKVGFIRLMLPVSRAVRAAATKFAEVWRGILQGFRCENVAVGAWLSLQVGLWELAGALERTGAAGACDTQGLKPGNGS